MSGGYTRGLTAVEWLWVNDFEPIYRTNSYEDGDGNPGEDADIDDTERYTNNINLTNDMIAEIDFRINPSNTIDNLILYLYKKIDSDWTGLERMWKTAITVSNDGSEFIFHYTIPPEYGPGHYRWGMKSDGASTTFEAVIQHVTARSWEVRRPNAIE